MRPTSVRFSEPVHAQLARAAEQDGISLSQYVREATLAYYVWRVGLEMGASLQTPDEVKRVLETLHDR